MAPTLVAIVGGVSYSLTDRNPYILLKEAGVGMAPLHRLDERGPQQHGTTDIGFWLDPRILTYIIGFQGSSESDYYDKRDDLLRIFAPASDPVYLKYTLDNGDVRQIDTHFLDDLAYPSDQRYGTRIQKAGLILRAADPLFYDPTLQVVDFGLGGGSGGFTVPVAVPMGVGASTIDQSNVIIYDGSFQENPVILITGPITNPIVQNTNTGEVLDFTGITIAALDTYTIDTRFGAKSVLNAAGTNKIGDLTDDSDLATFHLATSKEVAGGSNSIRVTGSGVTTATAVYIRYYNRYLGL